MCGHTLEVNARSDINMSITDIHTRLVTNTVNQTSVFVSEILDVLKRVSAAVTPDRTATTTTSTAKVRFLIGLFSLFFNFGIHYRYVMAETENMEISVMRLMSGGVVKLLLITYVRFKLILSDR